MSITRLDRNLITTKILPLDVFRNAGDKVVLNNMSRGVFSSRRTLLACRRTCRYIKRIIDEERFFWLHMLDTRADIYLPSATLTKDGMISVATGPSIVLCGPVATEDLRAGVMKLMKRNDKMRCKIERKDQHKAVVSLRGKVERKRALIERETEELEQLLNQLEEAETDCDRTTARIKEHDPSSKLRMLRLAPIEVKHISGKKRRQSEDDDS